MRYLQKYQKTTWIVWLGYSLSKSCRNWKGLICFIFIHLSFSSLFSWSYTKQEIARLRFRNSLQPGVGHLRHSQWKVQIQDTTNQMRGADGWRSARLRNESYTGLAGGWCLCTVIWAKLPCWAPCSSVQCQGRSMPPSSVKTPARTIRKPHTNIFTTLYTPLRLIRLHNMNRFLSLCEEKLGHDPFLLVPNFIDLLVSFKFSQSLMNQ